MSKLFFLLFSGGLTVFACTSSGGDVADSPSESGTPAEMRSAQNVSVTQLYDTTCANCHGKGGEGGGAGTKSLNTKDKYDQKHDKPYFDAIKNGVTDMGMEAYGATMSDEVVWSMVVHIRELQSRALRREFGSPKSVEGVYSSQRAKFKVEDVVTTGLDTPWSVDWLADGKMLLTNRSGSMHVYDGSRKIAEVSGLPASVEQGQGGLMEVRVHPSNGWTYLSLADPAKSGRGAMTKIYRGKIAVSGGTASWSAQQTIFEADQQYYSGAGIHFGSKIVFQGDYVFFSVGERGTNMRVQQSDGNPYGKVMRLHLDGKVPSDNPVSGSPMWTTGHRNPQGLTFDSEGNLWDTEHGPRGGDEVNLLKKGANYGWPVHALSINYNDTPFRTPWNKAGETFAYPVFRWLPSIGASGMDLVQGAAFPAWQGDILAGGLSGENLDRFRMKGGALVEHEELLHGLGRVRDVSVHKDGTVYVVLNRLDSSRPDRVVRLVVAD